MKMSGLLVEKVPKTYFVGMAWTLFTPLRDTISVSNNRIIFSGITIFIRNDLEIHETRNMSDRTDVSVHLAPLSRLHN